MSVDERIPPFLTVEEASRLLKIGRTKAYDLTKEWRATGGRSGLPVVDLGDVLRVPGPAIEKMLGTGLSSAPQLAEQLRTESAPTAPPPAPLKPTADERPAELADGRADAPGVPATPPVPATRTRGRRRRTPNQLPLFHPLTPTVPELPTPNDPELTTHP
jgi:hypothetical protein